MKGSNFETNRPFFFVIRDNKTGVILFMVKVEDPTIANASTVN